jgi:putative oxidoreductase
MKTLKLILETKNDWVGLVLRVTLGVVIFPHGAQKMLGAFGGFGFDGTMTFFTETVELPWIIAFSIICIEFIGSISLILGLASRLWSTAFFGLFLGIIFTTQLEHGFFMNWFGTQQGEGIEYSLLIIGLAIATFIQGSGKYSFDTIINSKIKQK